MKLSRKLNISVQKRELEFLPALYLLAWGLWILNPWINSFPSSAVFTEMAELAPEWAWGLGITLIGLFQMIVLFTKHYTLRAVAALASMFALIVMTIFVLLGNPASTAMITYLVIAVAAWLGYTEIMLDRKLEGKKNVR